MSIRDQPFVLKRSAFSARRWFTTPAVWLSLANLVCWVWPLVHGQGPYGNGRYALTNLYLGVPAALACLISLLLLAVPHSLRRPLAFRLGTALGAAIFAVALFDLLGVFWAVRFGEIWYFGQHFSKSENVSDPELVWKHRPGIAWRGRKTPSCDVVDYRTDENGFRNNAKVARPDIVFIGDSVTEAGEVDEDKSFVAKTGRALGVGVLNLGVSGYGPQQELVVLKRYGLTQGPKLVVWQVTEWNDVLDAETYSLRGNPAVPAGLHWRSLYLGISPVVKLVTWLLPPRLPRTVPFRRSDGIVEEQAFWPYQPDHHRQFPRGFAGLTRSLAQADALCLSRGIPFVVLYVPSHVRVLLPSLVFKNDAQRDRYCKGGRVESDDDLSHAVASACHALGCPLIDLFEPLRRRAERDNRWVYVRNDPHLGLDGHDEVARTLVSWLNASAWGRHEAEAIAQAVSHPGRSAASASAPAPDAQSVPAVASQRRNVIH
jgi:hypothetical protein